MKKKIIKYSIIAVIILIIVIFSFVIYKNLFATSNSSRYDDIKNYKLTNDEINSVKDIVKELGQVNDVDVYIDSKIIKIVVKLEDDIDFEQVKEKANATIKQFKEKNLTYYDVEFFVQSSNKDSEVYPQIGYKFKTNSEFSW